MKRSLDSNHELSSPSKRLRASPTLKHHRLNHHQPNVHLLFEDPQDDTAVTAQVSRALCVALYSAGFTSVQRRALESFTAAVQEYMHDFSRRVARSMHGSRRLQPIPQDFIHALAVCNLSSSSLEADLTLSIPPQVTQPAILPAAPLDTSDPSSTFPQPSWPFPSPADPTSPSQRKRHIPAHFPLLPPSHAYRDTSVFTTRETDVRRIRERATEEGMEAEKALRKLVKASKAVGRRKRIMPAGPNGKVVDKEEELWKETMAALADDEETKLRTNNAFDEGVSFGMDGAGDDPRNGLGTEAEVEKEVGMMVNYERAFWRKANRGGAVGAV